MTKALLSELLAKPSHDLLEIAGRTVHVTETGEVVIDPELAPILGDAVIEREWRHPAVMPMVLKVSLDDEPPPEVYGGVARENWRRRREAGYEMAQEQWDLFASTKHVLWARAVYAVLLFETWSTSMRSTPQRGRRWYTSSPWALVRAAVSKWNAMADSNRRADLAASDLAAFGARDFSEFGDVGDATTTLQPSKEEP